MHRSDGKKSVIPFGAWIVLAELPDYGLDLDRISGRRRPANAKMLAAFGQQDEQH
jgi:hypothetical protein